MFLPNNDTASQQNIFPFIAQISGAFEKQADQLGEARDKEDVRQDRNQPREKRILYAESLIACVANLKVAVQK
jgi:hypothetical protein